MSGQSEISKSQSLADKVRPILQKAIKILHDFLNVYFGGVDGFLVIWVSADCGTEPGSESREDFRVCEGTPLQYLGVCFGVLGDESGVGVLFGNYPISLASKSSQMADKIDK